MPRRPKDEGREHAPPASWGTLTDPFSNQHEAARHPFSSTAQAPEMSPFAPDEDLLTEAQMATTVNWLPDVNHDTYGEPSATNPQAHYGGGGGGMFQSQDLPHTLRRSDVRTLSRHRQAPSGRPLLNLPVNNHGSDAHRSWPDEQAHWQQHPQTGSGTSMLRSDPFFGGGDLLSPSSPAQPYWASSTAHQKQTRAPARGRPSGSVFGVPTGNFRTAPTAPPSPRRPIYARDSRKPSKAMPRRADSGFDSETGASLGNFRPDDYVVETFDFGLPSKTPASSRPSKDARGSKKASAPLPGAMNFGPDSRVGNFLPGDYADEDSNPSSLIPGTGHLHQDGADFDDIPWAEIFSDTYASAPSEVSQGSMPPLREQRQKRASQDVFGGERGERTSSPPDGSRQQQGFGKSAVELMDEFIEDLLSRMDRYYGPPPSQGRQVQDHFGLDQLGDHSLAQQPQASQGGKLPQHFGLGQKGSHSFRQQPLASQGNVVQDHFGLHQLGQHSMYQAHAGVSNGWPDEPPQKRMRFTAETAERGASANAHPLNFFSGLPVGLYDAQDGEGNGEELEDVEDEECEESGESGEGGDGGEDDANPYRRVNTRATQNRSSANRIAGWRPEFRRGMAPQEDVRMPLHIGAIELLMLLPNHTMRPAVGRRLIGNGFSNRQIAAVQLYGRGGHVATAQEADPVQRRYNTIKQHIQYAGGHGAATSTSNYATAGYALRDATAVEDDATLWSIGQRVVNWPAFEDAGIFTQAVRWALQTGNTTATVSQIPAFMGPQGWAYPAFVGPLGLAGQQGLTALNNPRWDQEGLARILAVLRAAGVRT